MPMLIPGSKRIVIQNISTEGPLAFSDPDPHTLIENCHIWVRPQAYSRVVDLTGGRLLPTDGR